MALPDLREFQCKECGHIVVVHPDLPADYTPSICCQCWNAGEPERQARMAVLAIGFAHLAAEIKRMLSDDAET